MNKNPIVLCSTVDGTNLTQYLCKTLLVLYWLIQPNLSLVQDLNVDDIIGFYVNH